MSTSITQNIFLIINRFAGHGKGESVVDIVVPFLKKNGCDVDYSFTQHPGHATDLAAKASKDGFGLVVAVGGDGTVNEVAAGLINSNTVMGIIPMGSGNGLARELGLSMNIRKSAATLIEGESLHIDVCRLNDQRFLCTSGIGFDALIADKMSKASSRGFLKYVQLVVQESIFYKPLNVRMKIDGVRMEKPVFLITFANASQFGNNAFIAPGASMTDELIDVVVVKKFSKIWMPIFAIALFSKLVPKLPFVDCYKAKSIELEVAETPCFHFDGEPGRLAVPSVIKLDDSKLWVRSRRL
ncbi:MAG: diacylglycerol kinase family lipid kinase [Prolixibacteraceae bacterium]|nr:diacylglycerol kinase family lipid kinase [Prolixibacteraceae bacterium]